MKFKALNDVSIAGYDWTSDKYDRKSIGGYAFHVFGCAVL